MPDSKEPKSIWTQIIDFISGIFNKGAHLILDVVLQIGGFLFLYVVSSVVLVGASCLMAYLSSNHLETVKLSWYGLFWIFFWLCLFIYFNRLLQKIKNEELNDSNSKGSFSFQKKINDFKKGKVFTLISLTIAAAYFFSNSFEETASGDFDQIITQTNISLKDFLMPFAILIMGTLTDIFRTDLKSTTASGKSVPFILLLGAIEFFSSILVFITGIVGGKTPLSAGENIKSFFLPPWDGFWIDGLFSFSWYPSEYTETSIHHLYHNLSSQAFTILYVAIPLLLFYWTHGLLKRKENMGIIPKWPEELLESTRRVCVVILFFVVYVGWHEGWLGEAYHYLAG